MSIRSALIPRDEPPSTYRRRSRALQNPCSGKFRWVSSTSSGKDPNQYNPSQILEKIYTRRSGSGKSTVCAKLSSILNLPHFPLDRYFWEPGWKETPAEEFRGKIEKIMSENEGGWIIDGEFRQHGGQIVSEHATDIIWLDPPLLLYFPRVVVRTFLRLFKIQEACSPGCKESWREVFLSKNSILLYCLNSHKQKRKVWKEEMAVIGVGVGSCPPNQQKLRRVGGWGNELKHWLRELEHYISQRNNERAY